ncbi:hypothetical protein D3C75_1202510 [compost metagenome]
MVGRTDGIAAHLLEFHQSVPPDFRGDGNSQAACILVDAQALNLHRLAVDEHSFVRYHLDFPHANPQAVCVHDFFSFI